MARSAAHDKAGGTLTRLKGRLKEASGALTGRHDRRSQGQVDQMKGAGRQARGAVKSKVR